MADSVTSHMAAYPIGAGVQVLLNPCAPHFVRLLGVHLLEHLVDVDGVGLAPLLLALQALGVLDARLSPRVTGRTPSHPYAPAERRAHQCMTEQVSARCTHCMSPRRRSKASTVARGVCVKLVLVVRCVPLSCLAPPFTLSRARCAVAWLAVTDSRLSPLSHGGKTEVCRAALP